MTTYMTTWAILESESRNKKRPEPLWIQAFNLVAGGGFEPPTFGL
jgi:hypothetical protein